MRKADAPTHRPQKSGGLLITGCPRSATTSVAKFFEDHGVHLGHQTEGEMGTIEWRYAYTEEPDFPLRMTLIRDPLDTVRSLVELLKHCDHKSDTWEDIASLSVQGGWDGKLKDEKFLEAATDWWTTVYKRLYRFPLIKVEHLPKLPELNHHRRVDRNFDMRYALKYENKFWQVTRTYGYYLGESDD